MSIKESLPIDVNGNREEVGYDSFYEKAISLLEKEACSAAVVIPEGPPIYLWPNDQYVAQRWDSLEFEAGWQVVNDIVARIPSKSHHFYLIDELNNKPFLAGESAGESEVDSILNQMAHTSPALLNSPLFQRDDVQERVRRYRESDFVRSDRANRCSNLDASFQREKLLFFIERYPEVTLENFKHLLLIVVHPNALQQQQALMLSALLGEMKNPPFNQIPKQQRRDIVSSIYRHVWIDENGGINSMTIPVWDGNRFVFTSLSL